MRARAALRAAAFDLPEGTGGTRRAVVLPLAVRAGLALHAVFFQLAVRAGLARRATLFQLTVRARFARRAIVFHLPVRAGIALRAFPLLLLVRAPLHSHRSRATIPRAHALVKTPWQGVVAFACSFVSSRVNATRLDFSSSEDESDYTVQSPSSLFASHAMATTARALARALARGASRVSREAHVPLTVVRHDVVHQHTTQTAGAARVIDSHFARRNGRHLCGQTLHYTRPHLAGAFRTQAPTLRRGFISLPAVVNKRSLTEFVIGARQTLANVKRAPAVARDAVVTSVEKALGPRVFGMVQSTSAKLATINPVTLLNPIPHIAAVSNKTRALLFRHKNAIYTVGQGFAVVGVWHGTLYFASIVTDVSNASQELAALGFATVVVILGTNSIKHRTRIDLDHVHALLLRRLDNHAGLREVLGGKYFPPTTFCRLIAHTRLTFFFTISAPIRGERGNARVALVTGGEWRLDRVDGSGGVKQKEEKGVGSNQGTKGSWGGGLPNLPGLPTSLWPSSARNKTKWRWRDERASVAFPIAGTRAGGFVFAECVKRAGKKVDLDLVAVDVFAVNGDSHRVFLSGGSKQKERADAILAALRVPLAVAMDDSYDDERALDAANAETALRVRTEMEKKEKVPKPLDHGGGMWPAEKVLDTAGTAVHETKRAWGKVRGLFK